MTLVSFLLCLEHAPDPRGQIAASRKALSPGGLLVIEPPDPECRFGRWLGRYWLPWMQPQHLHLLSPANYEQLLREEGLEPARTYHAEAYMGFDLSLALFMFCKRLTPDPNVPWQPRAAWYVYPQNWLVWICSLPFLAITALLDKVPAGTWARLCGCNAFGMVARRPMAG